MTQQSLPKGRIAISLAALISLFPSLALLYFWRVQTTAPEASNSQVAQTPVIRNVTSLGRVEPKGEVITVSGTNGSRISQLLVSEGQQLEKGQVIAYMEDYEERVAERDVAASQLAETRMRYESVTKYSEAQIEEANTRIDQIKQPQSFQIAAQKALVDRFVSETEIAKKDFERNQFLLREGAVSQEVVDEKAVNYFTKKGELENAKASLAQFTETRSRDLKNAEAQLKSAQASLANTQSEVQIASAETNLKLTEARLERSIIRAPRSGEVLDINTYAGEVIGEDGILDLGDLKQMYVVAEVYESDIGKIKLGQKATITDPSLPRKIEGEVERMSSQINKNDILDSDPAADTDSRVIEVKIRLNPEDSSLVANLINLQVDVEIASNNNNPKL
ncbi:MAG: ABC exporter membrane fusion protein [Waterburya sp.]